MKGFCMARTYERYKAHGELSPLAAHLLRLAKLFSIGLLVLISRRSIPAGESLLSLSSIQLEGNQLIRSQRETGTPQQLLWPSSAPLHAVWPDKVLYFNNALALQHATRFAANELFTSDQWGYAVYEKTGTKIHLYSALGEKLATHSASAWPRAIGSAAWLLLYTGDQSGLAFIDRKTGVQRGPCQGLASLITAVALAEKEQAVIFGTVDGSLEKFSLTDAKTLWRKRPPAGQLAVIKGLTVDQDSQDILVVSGARPETITRYSAEGKALWSSPTGGDLRTQVKVHSGQSYAASQTQHGLVLFKRKNGSPVRCLKPGLSAASRVSWTSFAETDSGQVYASVSAGQYTTLYQLGRDGQIDNCTVLPSPWVEISLADKAAHVLALASLDGVHILRQLENRP